MPKATKKTAEPKTSKAKKVNTPITAIATPNGEKTIVVYGLKVIYDKLQTFEHSTTSEHGAITPADAIVMLGWETEKQVQKRMVSEKPDTKPEQYLFGDDFHCYNGKGEKVRCSHNANNRPFDSGWCNELVETILDGYWAGPLTVLGETVNGETIRIGRYGRILSGQHQLTALILAAEKLLGMRNSAEYDPHNPPYPFWTGHDYPVLESLVVTGLSEDERILRTIDYVKPRSVADMLFTMKLFRNNSPVKRKELTRMLASGIDLLWDRTYTKGYKTHPEIVGFLQRHNLLLDCVEHLFTENNTDGGEGGRKISKLHLQPGQMSALCYLMGSSGPDTDGDVYRNPKDGPPSEKGLDWSHLERAKLFWSVLAGGKSFMTVREAITFLLSSSPTHPSNQGNGGTIPEKFAILSKAWEVYKDFPPESDEMPFTEEDLKPDGLFKLSYSDLDDKGNKLPDNQIKLLDEADFGGIDCLDQDSKARKIAKAPPIPPIATREEIEKAKAEADKRHGRLSPAELLAHNQQQEKEQAEKKRKEQADKLMSERKKSKG